MQPSSQTLVLTNLPAKEAEALAKEHKKMGARTVEMTKQSDGLFSLKVTYSDITSSSTPFSSSAS
jgi:hypothetical protein